MEPRLIKVIAIFTAFTLVACGEQKTSSGLYTKSDDDTCLGRVVPGRFIVRYSDGTVAVREEENEDKFLNGYLAENAHRIEYAEPDYRVHARQGAFVRQDAPAIDNWGVVRVGADTLWSAGIRGQGVIVAVVDSGADITHPQLRDRLAINAGEIPNNNVDDDGNGYVDDVSGYDFVEDRTLLGDHQMHGTHVSGIIVADHGDTTAGARPYVQGVAPEARLLPLAFLNKYGDGNVSDGVTAIKYAVAQGAKVINASWGGPHCSRTLRETIMSLEAQGVVFVAAAGNEGVDIDKRKQYPASLNLAAQFTVGNTGTNDYMHEMSNFGAINVHIFAPGSSIVSTVPNGFAVATGTSMSAPFVSGALALLLSAEPEATIPQLRTALYQSAYRTPALISASSGRLDLRTALDRLRQIMGK